MSLVRTSISAKIRRIFAGEGADLEATQQSFREARAKIKRNPQADADIPESCEPSDAVSAQGEGKDKKARKSRQTDKKEALYHKRRETQFLNLLSFIIRRFFQTLIEDINNTVDPVDSRIVECCKKLGGQMIYDFDETVFELRILIPF
jgi:hypothetical protein